MTRDEILNKIDNMIIYEKDFVTLNNLVTYCSPKLFTKILEEVFLGNLYISDFDSIFTSELNKKVNTEIIRQKDIEDRMYNLIALRKEIDKNSNFKSNIAIAIEHSQYDTEVDFEKRNIISELFNDGEDDVTERTIKEALYNKIIQDPKKFLLSRDNYLVPISYHDIVLDSYDYEFMMQNSITEEEMKKMKSLSLFLTNRGN